MKTIVFRLVDFLLIVVLSLLLLSPAQSASTEKGPCWFRCILPRSSHLVPACRHFITPTWFRMETPNLPILPTGMIIKSFPIL